MHLLKSCDSFPNVALSYVSSIVSFSIIFTSFCHYIVFYFEFFSVFSDDHTNCFTQCLMVVFLNIIKKNETITNNRLKIETYKILINPHMLSVNKYIPWVPNKIKQDNELAENPIINISSDLISIDDIFTSSSSIVVNAKPKTLNPIVLPSLKTNGNKI